MNVHFSSKTNEWATPQDLFNKLDDEFGFELDPCATEENAKCYKFFGKDMDGLKQEWWPSPVFMNPPYGREIGRWVEKAAKTAMGGGLSGLPFARPNRYEVVA